MTKLTAANGEEHHSHESIHLDKGKALDRHEEGDVRCKWGKLTRSIEPGVEPVQGCKSHVIKIKGQSKLDNENVDQLP